MRGHLAISERARIIPYLRNEVKRKNAITGEKCDHRGKMPTEEKFVSVSVADKLSGLVCGPRSHDDAASRCLRALRSAQDTEIPALSGVGLVRPFGQNAGRRPGARLRRAKSVTRPRDARRRVTKNACQPARGLRNLGDAGILASLRNVVSSLYAARMRNSLWNLMAGSMIRTRIERGQNKNIGGDGLSRVALLEQRRFSQYRRRAARNFEHSQSTAIRTPSPRPSPQMGRGSRRPSPLRVLDVVGDELPDLGLDFQRACAPAR